MTDFGSIFGDVILSFFSLFDFFYYGFFSFLFWWKIFAFIVSVALILGSIYCFTKLAEMKKGQIKDFVKIILSDTPVERNARWETIKSYLESENSSDWRRGIMDADILLNDIIQRIGYQGTTLGERLSKIKPAQLGSLEDAWDAHKVRNRIAHEGDNFDLNKKEAERVLGLYEKVFKDFEYL